MALLRGTSARYLPRGQIYFILFLLAVIAWVWIDSRHEWPAAIAIGLLVAIKPTFVFWPVFLFLAGHRRLAWKSIACTTAASLAPLFIYSPSIYGQWLAAGAHDLHWIFATNIALTPFCGRLGLPWLGVPLALVVAGLLTRWLWRQRPETKTTTAIGIYAGILCAPLAWSAYSILLAPAFTSRRWNRPCNVAAALLIVPSAVVALIGAHGLAGSLLGTSIHLIAICLILRNFAVD